jgi:glycosyltransferase involved in cell wall biosynthesis
MQIYDSAEPVVSVILPTFNREKYLERSIESVLAQSFELWELIVVDDGSGDGTFELVDGYLMKNPKIRYMKHTNRKSPLSFNAGILAACGEYVTFLCSDDKLKSEHLRLRVDYMRANPGIDFIHGGAEIVGYPYVKDKNDLSREINLSECVIGGTFFGKKEVFISLGGFRNLKYSDDSDFFDRAIARFPIAKVDFPTYIYYRDTPDSICSTIE